jgi:hypothetical protein
MISTQHLFEQHVIQEGLIRGLITAPYRFVDQFITNLSVLKNMSNTPLKKVEYINDELDKISYKFSDKNLDLSDSNHKILKALDKLSFWRFYIILNDKVFKASVDQILSDGKGKNVWVDANFKDRHIPLIYNIKSSKDIDQIIQIYKDRVNKIYQLSKKHPEKAKEFNKLLLWGLYGLIDLFAVIHSVVSYGSKGL